MSLAVILISAIAAVINVSIGILSLGFSRAPGWASYRLFAYISFLLGIYAFNDVAFLHLGQESSWSSFAARTNLQIGSTIAGLWVVYFRWHFGQSVTKSDRMFLYTIFPIACLGWIPGVLTTGTFAVPIPSLGISYLSPKTTFLGDVLMMLSIAAMLVVAVRYVREAKKGSRGALAHAIGFGLLSVLALEEVLVTMGGLSLPYLADLGFTVLLFLAAMDMSARVSKDSISLQELNTDLEKKVKQYSDELLTTQEALWVAERQAALERMAAGVGHEINNPLTSIGGNLMYIGKAIERRKSWDEEREAIEEALDGVGRIQAIVADLTMLSKSNTQTDEAANPERAIALAIRMVKPLFRAVDFEVEMQTRVGGGIDEGKLTQVLVNLLSNAAFATMEYGDHSEREPVLVLGCEKEGMLCIEVRDRGAGIEEDVMHRIFDPLFTTKKVGAGTGLGLYVCKSILDSAGGSLRAQHNTPRGTSFVLQVVAMELSPAPQKASLLPAVPFRSGLRIYLIDDEPFVARAIARMLPKHECTIENDSEKALERLLQGESFDLILCDLMMPKLSGMDLYREVISKRPELKKNFLFITGGAVTADSQAFVEAQESRCLRKPLDLPTLLRAIDQQI